MNDPFVSKGTRALRRMLLACGVAALLWAGVADIPATAATQQGTAAVEPDGAAAAAPQRASMAGGTFRLSAFHEGSYALLWDGIGFLVTLPLLWWMLSRPRRLNEIPTPGFEVITDSENRRFIPLEEKFQHMDFLAGVETQGSLRLSANLNKVNLSFRRYGYLLEDKNFRNALLVNRRRVRRTLLRDGDVLDLGDLTLLYRDNREVPIVRHSAVTPREGKVQIRFERLRGPVRKGTPVLVPESQPTRSFFITKNIAYIGRSEINDLVIKSQNVDYRHAKIERVGSRYKLLDLSASGNTYVNNRRVEQRMLREGDEVSIDNQRFRFKLVTKMVTDSPSAPRPSAQQEDEEEGVELAAVEEGGGRGEEPSSASEARN